MIHLKRTVFPAALIVLAALAYSPAYASLIPPGSQIDFTGGLTPIGGANSYDSTGIDFRTNGQPSPNIPGSVSISNTSGGPFTQFSAASCPNFVSGGCGTVRDLTNYIVAEQLLVSPALPVLSFITFTQGNLVVDFDLTNFAVTQVQPNSNMLGTLTLSGAGTLNFAGYDDTPAIFTITAQGPGNTTFSGSLVAEASTVPEPASMVVLFAGLMGLAVVRRRSTCST